MYSFSACMTSKISQNLGPISLKECNGAALNRLKRISGLGPQIPHQVIRAPCHPVATPLNSAPAARTRILLTTGLNRPFTSTIEWTRSRPSLRSCTCGTDVDGRERITTTDPAPGSSRDLMATTIWPGSKVRPMLTIFCLVGVCHLYDSHRP